MSAPNTTGERIRQLRKRQRKLTAEAVSSAIGISRAHLSMIENGRDLPGRDTLSAIADYFAVSVDYLLHGGDAAPQAPQSSQFVDDPDELAWLAFWRGLSMDERRTVLKLLSVPDLS